MSDPLSTATSDLGLTNLQAVNSQLKDGTDRIAGLRLSYLIRQHIDRGWTLERLANAIGCHASLLTKWRDPSKVRSGLGDRSGLRDQIIGGVRRGLRISSEYFFVSAKDLPSVVVMPDGSERPAEPGEVDCYAAVFSLDKKRGEIDQAARKQIADQELRLKALEGTNRELATQVSRLTLMIERLLGSTSVR